MKKILILSIIFAALAVIGIFMLPQKEIVVVIQNVPDTPAAKKLSEYIEITNSCGPYHDGDCLNARSGPGPEFDVLTTLRRGAVLKISGSEIVNGKLWYKVVFEEWLRYHDRLPKHLYVSGDFVRYFIDEGTRETPAEDVVTSTKRIVIDISEQSLSAYEGNELFLKAPVSTGVNATPTSLGTFWIYRKTPSRYMQGPIPDVSEKAYDLPGVPWDLYFTEGGAVIHGAYWHDKFGTRWSNGCVNLTPENARTLYYWADVGVPVFVQE